LLEHYQVACIEKHVDKTITFILTKYIGQHSHIEQKLVSARADVTGHRQLFTEE